MAPPNVRMVNGTVTFVNGVPGIVRVGGHIEASGGRYEVVRIVDGNTIEVQMEVDLNQVPDLTVELDFSLPRYVGTIEQVTGW